MTHIFLFSITKTTIIMVQTIRTIHIIFQFFLLSFILSVWLSMIDIECSQVDNSNFSEDIITKINVLCKDNDKHRSSRKKTFIFQRFIVCFFLNFLFTWQGPISIEIYNFKNKLKQYNILN